MTLERSYSKGEERKPSDFNFYGSGLGHSEERAGGRGRARGGETIG